MTQQAEAPLFALEKAEPLVLKTSEAPAKPKIAARPPLSQRLRTRLDRLRSTLRRVRLPFGRQRYRHLFIVTYGRTGSTLLQKIFGSLPGYYVAGENHNSLFGIYQSYRNARILSDKYGWGYQKPDHPWHGAHAADPDRFARQMVAAFVKTILRPPRGAKVIGFKEIRYIGVLDELYDYLMFMAQFFAPATFVINTRSVEEVAQSSWWKYADKDQLAQDVARFHEITDRIVADHPDRFVKVGFEQWTTDPHALRPAFDMLGAPFDADAVSEILGVRLNHHRI